MTTLAQAYPELRSYTAEELALMPADQIASILQGVTKAGQQINTSVIQLQTQAHALDQQVQEETARIQQEFGVSTSAELEELRQRELTALAQIYTDIGALATEPQQTA